MRFGVQQGSLTEAACDALIVNLLAGVKMPGGGTGAVDRALGGAISEMIADEEFEGRLGDVAVIPACGAIPAKRVLLVGLGDSAGFGALEIMKASAAAIRKCRELRARNVVSILHGAGIVGIPAYECARAVVLGTILGAYEHSRLKTRDVKPDPIEAFEIVELSAEKLGDIENGMRRAEIIGEAICFARDLSNEPSNIVTPDYLAEQAAEIGREFGMQYSALDRAGIENAGLGLVAAVARGSSTEPRFVRLEYRAESASRTIALIGKGVTFDTGGHSLKKPDSMYGMHDDMSGAAAVLAAMRAIGKLKPNVNVIALVPALENAIGGDAIHPGDVFKALDGRSVEVVSTDAEGRLILGDAVAYARKLGVDEIINAATLTSACVVALGRKVSGIIGNDQRLVDNLIRAGRSCGEKLWQLPLEHDYDGEIRSRIADLRNNGKRREAGAISAALFIESFSEGIPWAHIDLSSATVINNDEPLAREGSTGAGTGTLIEYLMQV